MSASNVQLVVDHVRTGYIIRDHRHAVAVGGARRVRNLLATDGAGRG